MGAFDPLVRTGDFQEVWRLILTDPAFRVRRRSSSDEVTEAAAVPRHPAQNPVYSAPRTLNDDTEPAQRLSVLAPAIEALREDVASGAWQRWTSVVTSVVTRRGTQWGWRGGSRRLTSVSMHAIRYMPTINVLFYKTHVHVRRYTPLKIKSHRKLTSVCV